MRTFHFSLIAMLSAGLAVQAVVGGDAAVLPDGWVLLDDSGKTQVQVIEGDGSRFIRVTTSVPRAIGFRFPVEYEWAKVQATMKLRVREIKSDKPAGGEFRGRQLGTDRHGAGLNPGGAAQRLREVTGDWVDYTSTGRVSPREVYRTAIAGFDNASGTFDLASEVQVDVIDKRPPYQDRAPECTVRGGLPNFVQKLNAGKNVRIAYLGGSITAQKGYRTQTLDWFRKQYPQATIDEIVAAIGGTGSDLGAFRVGADVIAHKPDMVFIEFAVNDATQPPQQIHRTMEGIVRQIRAADPLTDICFVYTVMDQHEFLDDLAMGQYPNSARAMEDVANHYGIPTIHMGIEAARLEREGKAYFRKSDSTAVRRQAMKDGIYFFASDGVHPFTDTGHVLYTRAVVRAMEHILPASQAKPRALPQPLDPDHWQDARMIPFGEAATLDGKWTVLPADHPFAEAHKNRFAKIWMGKPGGKATFHVKGRAVATFELIGPSSGRVRVSLNGKALDPEDRFLEQGINQTDGRLRHFPITYDLNPSRVHTVTLEVADYSLEEKQQILRRQRGAGDAHAEQSRFAESNLYGGMLLLRGEVVK